MGFEFFQIEVTRNCSMSCVMCPSQLFKNKSDMDFEIFEMIANYFDKTKLIHLQGWGEPLLQPRILDMVKISRENAVTGLTTNGVYLKRFAEDLVRLGLDYIAVSISGEKTHAGIRRGSNFSQVLEGVEHLIESKKKEGSESPRINLTFLMTVENYKEIESVFNLAVKMRTGLVLTNLDCVFDDKTYNMRVFDSRKSEEVSKIIKGLSERAEREGIFLKYPSLTSVESPVCDAMPDSAIVFSAEGDIYPCVYLNLPLDRIPRYFRGKMMLVEKPKFGNICDGLDGVWGSADYRKFREIFKERIRMSKSWRFRLGLGGFRIKPDAPRCCTGCYKLYGI